MCISQPVITNQPRTQATAPGAIATFQVGATGTAPLAYQWQKNPGNGFSDLANCTNAALVLTNVQPWDACDYRVVITNLTAGRTSAVARLYVMRPALVTTNVVVDNFDDNLLTDWEVHGVGSFMNSFFNTNQQLTVRGYFPGIHTVIHEDSQVYGGHSPAWTVPNGQTREWRVDLVRLDENATNTALLLVGTTSGLYAVHKSRDFVFVLKWPSASGGISILACERAAVRNTNVVLILALTRVQPNLVVAARVLDKANLNNVLYQCTVVDTPNVDPTINAAQFQALTGMNWQDVGPSELAGAPFTSFRVGFGLFQYTDGTMPVVHGTFDNLELWTSLIPVTRYVDVNSTNPTPPYTNWLTAATNIQDAVDAALAGDEIVVTNGTYATGGRAVGTNLLVNRVAVDKPLTVWSVNGPQSTVINGGSTDRCAYLSDGASLSGFTLTQGVADNGGGVRCASTNAFLAHCVIAGNSATSGGGAYGGTLDNCMLMDNSATDGGGAWAATLNNCTVVDNVAWNSGGGVASSTLANSIVAYNAASTDANYTASTLDYCCTSPLPTGGWGNITLPPLFVDYASGNLHLQSNSPCINAGRNAFTPGPTDLDSLPRIVSGTVDIGAYEFQGPGSVISYAWLQHYGLPTDGSADGTDPDADGHTTWQEWLCQTDPTNALSALRLLTASPAGTNVTLTWQSVAGVDYFLERSTNLSATPPFTLLAPNLPGQPGTTSFTDSNAANLAPLFYRVGVGN